MLKKKILAAILSSVLFALVFTIFGNNINELERLFNLYSVLYYLNLMFAITYGVLVSIFSDWLCNKIATKKYIREIISFAFHCFCGGILLIFGLVSAILFFLVDRLLGKVKVGWLSVGIALSIVVLVFIIIINYNS